MHEEGKEVKIRESVIFEITYQEIQKSPKYKSGYALRFPRLKDIRDDLSLEDVDTIDRVERLYSLQKKG